jgi:hypothetical protein
MYYKKKQCMYIKKIEKQIYQCRKSINCLNNGSHEKQWQRSLINLNFFTMRQKRIQVHPALLAKHENTESTYHLVQCLGQNLLSKHCTLFKTSRASICNLIVQNNNSEVTSYVLRVFNSWYNITYGSNI